MTKLLNMFPGKKFYFQRKFSRETTDMKNNGKALPYSSLLNNFLEARENVPDNDNNNMQSDLTCM